MPSRRLPAALALALLGAAALAHAEAPAPRPKVSTRKVGTSHEAWLGHWRSDDGKTDYFVTPHDLVMVDNGKPQPQMWAVLEEDDHTLDCAILVPTTGADPNRGHVKKMKFSPDYRKIDYTITIRGATIDSHLSYVDDKQQPPK